MSQLTLLLENLYNAPWPNDFNAEGFVTPEMESIQDSKDIRELDDEEQQAMGNALVKENADMQGTMFYGVWVQPVASCIFLINKKK